MAARSFLERRWLYVLIVATIVGVLIRSAWAVRRVAPLAGEAQSAARALASGRGLADPYFVGSGPSAHLMPTTPLVAGGIYDLFGIGSPTSEIILQSLAFIGIFGTSALLFVAFRRLGLPIVFALGAYCFLAGVPLFMGPETLDYRYWEGALATLLLAAMLVFVVFSPPRSLSGSIFEGGGSAIACFVSPPVGIACLAMVGYKFAIERAWRSVPIFALAFAVAGAGLFGPWVHRNKQVLGEPIVLRSNLGLELAIANNISMYNHPTKANYDATLNKIHPSQSAEGAAEYVRVGEVVYFDGLKQGVIDWITTNPTIFVRLSLRHVWQMIWPQPWAFEIGSGVGSGFRSVIYGLVALFGLTGVSILAATVDRRFCYPLIAAATIVLCYFPFQPVARYLYLNYAMLAYCASTALWMLQKRAMNSQFKTRPEPMPTTTPE